MQIGAISELFDATTLLVPVQKRAPASGGTPLAGRRLKITPLSVPRGRGAVRKLALPLWLIINSRVLAREVRAADAVHAPIPGDVGTAGMFLAMLFRRPLFVRHCGNWTNPRTSADYFWKWCVQYFGGGKNVMLATGWASTPPSRENSAVQWIFATSLRRADVAALSSPREDAYPQRPPRLVVACRQERDKGTDTVLRALPAIRAAFPGATLDVAGDGSALRELKDLAKSLMLEDHVHFHGRIEQARVIELLRKCDLLCYPTSASEGFPKVVLEALACGLPVVSTPVSVIPSLVGDSRGAIVREAAPEGVAKAVVWCLEDPARYRRMSIEAASIAEQYSLETWRDTIGMHLSAAWGPLREAI